MTVWRRAMARGAWTAFLMLFVFRAVAGAALCDLNVAHKVPAGVSHAMGSSGITPKLADAAQAFKTQGQSHAPSNDRDEHACEEPAYLTGEPATLSTLERSPKVDAIACSYAPAGDWTLAVAATNGPHRRSTHPPTPRTPLDIAPRLRI